MPPEDKIRKLLNLFDEADMRDTYGTGVTQRGDQERPRPGRGRVKTADRHTGTKPLGRSTVPARLPTRSTPSDT